MNNQDELIKELINTIQASKTFVLAEYPDVIRQYFRWAVIHNVFYLVLGLVALIVLVKLSLVVRANYNEYNFPFEGYLAAIIFLAPVALFSICPAFLELIQIYVAPKIFLLGTLRSLVRK